MADFVKYNNCIYYIIFNYFKFVVAILSQHILLVASGFGVKLEIKVFVDRNKIIEII